MQDATHCWESDGCAWVRVVGKASAVNSPIVKDFARKVFDEGIHDLTIDLSECTILDDTFLGTMAAVTFMRREREKGSVRVVGCSPVDRRQIEDSGLDQIFHVE